MTRIFCQVLALLLRLFAPGRHGSISAEEFDTYLNLDANQCPETSGTGVEDKSSIPNKRFNSVVKKITVLVRISLISVSISAIKTY